MTTMALSCSKKAISIFERNFIKNNGDFYCLNCLHFFRTKHERESHKKVCEKKYFCNVIMPSEDTKIWEFNQYQKSAKASFIVYAGFQCIIGKTDWCRKNPKNSSSTKNEHITSCFSMTAIERGKDCMKKFCQFWR